MPICSKCTHGTLSNIQFLEDHFLFNCYGHYLHIEACLEELQYINKCCCLQALSSDLTKIVEGEMWVGEYNSTSNDAFDSFKSIEFGKEYRKRNVNSNAWEQFATNIQY